MSETIALATDEQGTERTVIIVSFEGRKDVGGAGGEGSPLRDRYFLENDRGGYGAELFLQADGRLGVSDVGPFYNLL